MASKIEFKQIGQNLNWKAKEGRKSILGTIKISDKEERESIKAEIEKFNKLKSFDTPTAEKKFKALIEKLQPKEKEKIKSKEEAKAKLKVEKKVVEKKVKEKASKKEEVKISKEEATKVENLSTKAEETKQNEQPKAKTGSSWTGERYR